MLTRKYIKRYNIPVIICGVPLEICGGKQIIPYNGKRVIQ